MSFIFSTPALNRRLWQLKTVVFLHWYIICAVLLLYLGEENTLTLNLEMCYHLAFVYRDAFQWQLYVQFLCLFVEKLLVFLLKMSIFYKIIKLRMSKNFQRRHFKNGKHNFKSDRKLKILNLFHSK
jgi:hypothetical protein